MLANKVFQAVAIAIVTLSVASCGGENVGDLKNYIKQVKSRQKSKVEELPKPVMYESYAYVKEKLRDPFLPKARKRIGGTNTHIKLQCRPPRDVLEGFPLDSLKMVGILEQKGERWALIRGKDGTLYRTKKGRCMGQDDGKIIKITESEIILRETVSDGLGGRMQRKTVLSASE